MRAATMAIFQRKKKGQKATAEEAKAKQEHFIRNGAVLLEKQVSLFRGKGMGTEPVRSFSAKDIMDATNNYDHRLIIGRKLATVFKGVLDGRTVAVKVAIRDLALEYPLGLPTEWLADFFLNQDVNFWGSVNCTRFALAHLKGSKGKIGVIASVAPWTISPKMSVYNASKAALISFFETLRIELIGSHIGIKIATSGFIGSEITSDPTFLAETGLGRIPSRSPEKCAEAIVDSICRGDRYVTEPSWSSFVFLFKGLYPQLLEWFSYRVAIRKTKRPFQGDPVTSQ